MDSIIRVPAQVIGRFRIALNLIMKLRLRAKKSFALSLAFVMRFKAIRKWRIDRRYAAIDKNDFFCYPAGTEGIVVVSKSQIVRQFPKQVGWVSHWFSFLLCQKT